MPRLDKGRGAPEMYCHNNSSYPKWGTNQSCCFHIVKHQYRLRSLHTALLLAVEDCQVPSVINSPGSTWAFTSLEIVSTILLCLIKLHWFVMYTGCYPLFLLFTLYFKNNYTMPTCYWNILKTRWSYHSPVKIRTFFFKVLFHLKHVCENAFYKRYEEIAYKKWRILCRASYWKKENNLFGCDAKLTFKKSHLYVSCVQSNIPKCCDLTKHLSGYFDNTGKVQV